MKLWSTPLAAGLALLLGCAGGAGQDPAPAPPGAPNVVVILIDTLRPDHLDLHGYERETAPFLRELAAGSAVFERAFSSSSWTAPAVASLFTGLYPPEHGIVEGFLAFKRREQKGPGGAADQLPLNRLPGDARTMAELFRGGGFRTFGVSTNLNIGPEIGFDRAFDEFQVFVKDDAETVRAALREWRAELEQARPHFLYLHFMEPHVPYERRAPWYERQDEKIADDLRAYDSEIRYLDGVLGELYREFGWAENTVLVVASDHGEEFGEHGGSGHEFSLYGELNRVLLLVRAPDMTSGKRITANVSLVDVLPTVLALAGLEVPPGLSGMNLVPLLQRYDNKDIPAYFQQRPIYAHRARVTPELDHLWAVVVGDYKLLQSKDGLALYQVRDDPLDQRNLLGMLPEVEAALKTELARFRGRGIRKTEQVTVELDPELLRALEELGYVETEDGGR